MIRWEIPGPLPPPLYEDLLSHPKWHQVTHLVISKHDYNMKHWMKHYLDTWQ